MEYVSLTRGACTAFREHQTVGWRGAVQRPLEPEESQALLRGAVEDLRVVRDELDERPGDFDYRKGHYRGFPGGNTETIEYRGTSRNGFMEKHCYQGNTTVVTRKPDFLEVTHFGPEAVDRLKFDLTDPTRIGVESYHIDRAGENSFVETAGWNLRA